MKIKQGRKRLPPEVARNYAVRVMFTEGQAADLEHIAKSWGCGVATVVFALTAGELAEARKMMFSTEILGMEFASAVRLHAQEQKRQPDV